jgi:8-oxo-dGTP pyrophosphatase MutT (NUDIX family)
VIPEWLRPVRDGAAEMTVQDLTRFLPPDDFDGRTGAVLVLFGEGPAGPDLLLTERAHHMRSHPGQVSFPGGSVEPGETPVAAAVREAVEETGLDATGVHVFGELPELWLPPSNFAVTPVLAWWHAESPVDAVDPDEVHAVYRVPLDELLDPTHRISVRHPRFPDYTSPAFLIGEAKDLVLWGFTAGIISRLFDFVGWTRAWDPDVVRDVPDRMVQGGPPRTAPPAPDARPEDPR